MKKRFLILILLIVGLFTITGCGCSKKTNEDTKNKKEIITPLMYKVTKEGSSNTIYILGTIHAGSLKNTEFAKYVTKAFDESHYVAAEIDNEEDESLDEVLEQLEKFTYDGDDTIKNHMSSEENYNKLMKYVEDNNLEIELIDKEKLNLEYYSRSLTQVVIEKSGLTAEEGIDEYFVNMAKKEKKNFLVVEGTEFQSEVLASLSDKFYENMIISAIENLDEQIKELKDSFEIWKKGNEKEIWKDDGSSIKEEDKSKYSEEDIKAAEEFDEKILYSRNITMTDKLEEYFKDNKDVFYMVGQDHVIGDRGIVSLLRQRGYTVTKISK
ncbi:MAG: TraB/GumN family protein [Bacilli bacterium]|nr:TraB/GumN family protein [Bacilli bacterium]